MSSETKKFYVTTPIYYVNARPHIGHAYTTIVADVLARRHRLLGDRTFFLTGTDEHGQKIERSAAAAGIPPQQFTDQVSAEFRTLWDRMGLTYDRYIRTTDPAHIRGAQRLFQELWDRDAIYLDRYTGAYCVSDEAFVDVPVGTPCPDCGRITEEVTEENFFFRLSLYQRPLIDLIESGTLRVEPKERRNEVLSFLRGDVNNSANIQLSHTGVEYVPGALKDLSISRSSFTWGIPVPQSVLNAAEVKQPHVIYVWLDALSNYMTAIGYGSDDPKAQEEFKVLWPADLHLVGKEIIRFHCVYWPAFLLAADLPLPKAITAHGWLLFDNSKMSKSKGNIVRTETILEAFGEHVYAKQFPDSTKQERDLFAADVLRYFLLREIPFGQDGSFSFDALVTRYNADLANGYGNLVSRTLNMISQYREGAIPTSEFSELLRSELIDSYRASEAGYIHLRFGQGLQAVWEMITATDQFVSEAAPWKLSKDPTKALELDTVLYNAAEAIRCVTAMIAPVLPTSTAKVWEQLGLGWIGQAVARGELTNLEWGDLKPGIRLGPLAPIFPRAPKELAQIMQDIEAARAGNTGTQNSMNSELKTAQISRPDQPLKTAATPTAAAPIANDPTHPAAAPRTSSLDEPSGTLPVAGSSAGHAVLPTTPGAHTEAPGSGPFANQQSPTESDSIPQINIDDFLKVELRVAQVLVAERIPKADKLLRLEVDLGFEKRQILSGIAQWYTPEELIGRRIAVVANLAPRKMRGLESHGMLLAASAGEGDKPVLATFSDDVTLGSRVR